jgi:hypothetical protein
MSDDEYSLIERGMPEYPCGLRAGDQLRLRTRLAVTDSSGRATRKVHEPGEIWTVVAGARSEPRVVWLQQPDGEPHTWDDFDIFESFERITDG